MLIIRFELRIVFLKVHRGVALVLTFVVQATPGDNNLILGVLDGPPVIIDEELLVAVFDLFVDVEDSVVVGFEFLLHQVEEEGGGDGLGEDGGPD